MEIIKKILRKLKWYINIVLYYINAKYYSYREKNKTISEVIFIDRFYMYNGIKGNYRIKFLGKFLYTPWLPLVRVQLRSFFKLQEYNFELKENPTIIDAGSNIGTAVIYYNYQYKNPNVIALEADSNICSDYLLKNLDSFGLKNKTTVLNKALWSSNKILKFNSIGLDNGSVSIDGNIEVQAISLDELIDKYNEIDLLKLDVEGAEFEVLKACRQLNKISNMYIEMEMDSRQDYEHNILKILKDNGFEYYVRSTTKYQSPVEMFNSKEDITYYFHIFARRKKI